MHCQQKLQINLKNLRPSSLGLMMLLYNGCRHTKLCDYLFFYRKSVYLFVTCLTTNIIFKPYISITYFFKQRMKCNITEIIAKCLSFLSVLIYELAVEIAVAIIIALNTFISISMCVRLNHCPFNEFKVFFNDIIIQFVSHLVKNELKTNWGVFGNQLVDKYYNY